MDKSDNGSSPANFTRSAGSKNLVQLGLDGKIIPEQESSNRKKKRNRRQSAKEDQQQKASKIQTKLFLFSTGY